MTLPPATLAGLDFKVESILASAMLLPKLKTGTRLGGNPKFLLYCSALATRRPRAPDQNAGANSDRKSPSTFASIRSSSLKDRLRDMQKPPPRLFDRRLLRQRLA